jgi:hypothetical protein
MFSLLATTIHHLTEFDEPCATLAEWHKRLWSKAGGLPGAGLRDFYPGGPVERLALVFYRHPRHQDPRA